MPTLPASTDFTGSGITEAEFKTAMTNMRGFLSDLLGTAGTQAAAQVALQTLLGAGVAARSGAYTVVAGDRGKLINATGTWALALPAAATAGAGFAFALRNSGTGGITIDPNATELIDGAQTLTLAAGGSAIIVCTGSAWMTVGLGAQDVVKHDHGHNVVGSLCFAGRDTAAGVVYATAGEIKPGSEIKPSGISPLKHAGSGSLSGSWRCLGHVQNVESFTVNVCTLWQRIA
jgi:hypothetical protein